MRSTAMGGRGRNPTKDAQAEHKDFARHTCLLQRPYSLVALN